MQRYFIDPKQIHTNTIDIIDRENIHHIRRVMRFNEGDRIVCADGSGRDFLVEIAAVSADAVRTKILERLQESAEPPMEITIAQALPKADKMEWVIQKGTELGASRFVPFVSERTIVKLDEKKESRRLERWRRIAKEAAEQSHRSILPQVEGVATFKELMQNASAYDLALFAYENEAERSLSDVLRKHERPARILLVIGPEGGFSSQEVREAAQHLISVSLGRRILRTETAGLYMLSCLSFYYESDWQR